MEKEKLIIKNFGPIKAVELKLNRFNVLIGQQGTGKSTIAKLYSILNDVSLIKNADLDIFLSQLSNFNIRNFYRKSTVISYSSNAFEFEINNGNVRVSSVDKSLENLFELNARLEEAARNFLVAAEKVPINTKLESPMGDKSIGQLKSETLYLLSNVHRHKVYIPSERIVVSMVASSPFSFINNPITLPKYVTDFGQFYEYAKGVVGEIKFDFLNVRFESDMENGDTLSFLNSRAKIKLSESSSGYQSIIPLLVGLNEQKGGALIRQFVIEEPEQNLFPSTQYDLIKYIVNSNPPDSDVLITTHSPYTLAALNNLMFAHEVGKDRPRLISKIIEKHFWLNPREVSAYLLKSDGTAESVIDEEVMQIKAEYIDDVSRIINAEYDAMLDVKYSKKK